MHLLSKMPKALQAASTGTVIAATAAGVAFLVNLLISIRLGPSQRGQVAFVLQVSYVVAPLMMLGADNGLLRAGSSPDRLRSKQHLLPMAVITAVGLLIFFADWTVLAAPVAYASSWIVLTRSASYRDHTFRSFAVLMLSYQTFIAGSTIVLFALSIQEWWAWLLPYVLPAAGILVYDLSTSTSDRFRHPFNHLTATSLALLPTALSLVVILRLDRVILGILSGDSALGLYVTVATATETLSWVGSSIADHRVAHLKRDRTRLSLISLLGRDLLLFGGLAVIVALMVRNVLLPILGPEYLPASSLVVPLTLAALGLALFRQTVSWAMAGSHPGRVSVLTGSSACLAIPVYIWSISNWGAMGAAWACLAVYAGGAILGILIARDDSARKQAQ